MMQGAFGAWVYQRTEPGLWTVGFYSPDGEWFADSDHGSSEAAAQRVHWLNGGAVLSVVDGVVIERQP